MIALDRTRADRITSRGDSVPLRRVLLVDAALCASSGFLLALAAGPLAGWFGLPDPLLRVSGLFLLPFATFLAYAGTRRRPERSAILAIATANLLWVLGSIGLLLGGLVEPTAIGYGFVIAQVVVVALFIGCYVAGLRAPRPVPD